MIYDVNLLHLLTRYGLYCLRCMEALPDQVSSAFMEGHHVMQQSPRVRNDIWSDIIIETTLMRHGHDSGGQIGLCLKPSAIARWALSLHICSQLRADLASLKNGHQKVVPTEHKEENRGRISADSSDREEIRETLAIFIDLIDPTSHSSPGLLNIASGLLAPSNANVDDAVSSGTKQMNGFESGWPNSFNASLRKNVVTKVTIMCHDGWRSNRVS